jgi:hypothetical protein
LECASHLGFAVAAQAAAANLQTQYQHCRQSRRCFSAVDANLEEITSHQTKLRNQNRDTHFAKPAGSPFHCASRFSCPSCWQVFLEQNPRKAAISVFDSRMEFNMVVGQRLSISVHRASLAT